MKKLFMLAIIVAVVGIAAVSMAAKLPGKDHPDIEYFDPLVMYFDPVMLTE